MNSTNVTINDKSYILDIDAAISGGALKLARPYLKIGDILHKAGHDAIVFVKPIYAKASYGDHNHNSFLNGCYKNEKCFAIIGLYRQFQAHSNYDKLLTLTEVYNELGDYKVIGNLSDKFAEIVGEYKRQDGNQ